MQGKARRNTASIRNEDRATAGMQRQTPDAAGVDVRQILFRFISKNRSRETPSVILKQKSRNDKGTAEEGCPRSVSGRNERSNSEALAVQRRSNREFRTTKRASEGEPVCLRGAEPTESTVSVTRLAQ